MVSGEKMDSINKTEALKKKKKVKSGKVLQSSKLLLQPVQTIYGQEKGK